MSFLSEKDLKKIPNKKPIITRKPISSNTLHNANPISTPTFSSMDHIQSIESHQELVRFSHLDQLNVDRVTKIQRVWRRFNSWKITRTKFYSEFDEKINNIIKLQEYFKQKQQSFCCPNNTSLYLLRILSHFFRSWKDIQHIKGSRKMKMVQSNLDDYNRLKRFCEHIFLPSLDMSDMDKNIVFILQSSLNCLCKSFMVILMKSIQQSSYNLAPSMILVYIRSYVALQSKRDEITLEITNAFQNIQLFTSKAFNTLNEVMSMMIAHLRKYLAKFSNNIDGPQNAFHVVSNIYPHDSAFVDIIDKLFWLLMDIIKSYPIDVLYSQILTLPLVCFLIRQESLVIFIKSSTFESVINYILENQKNTLTIVERIVSVSPELKSCHWFLGNMAFLGPYVVEEHKKRNMEDSFMIKYFHLLTILMNKYPLNSVFCGHSSVYLDKIGSNLIAQSIPQPFISQLIAFGLLHTSMNRTLIDYINVVLPQSDPKYQLQVEDSLKHFHENSSIAIAQKSLQDEKISSVSKWSQKLLSSLSSSMKSSVTSSTKNQLASDNLNIDLLKVIMSFWSLLLPIISDLSSVESNQWKGLTAIAFFPNAIHRFFGLLIMFLPYKNPQVSDIERYCNEFNISDSNDVAFHVIKCLVSLLKVSLIICDDNDIYKQNQPLGLDNFIPLISGFKVILGKYLQYDARYLQRHKLFIYKQNLKGDIGRNNEKDIEMNKKNLFDYFTSFISKGSLKDNTNQEEILVSKYQQSHLIDFSSISMCRCISSVLSDLYLRWSRRPFTTSDSIWEISSFNNISMKELVKTQNYQQQPIFITIFQNIPWTLRFHNRLNFFKNVVDNDRVTIQGTNDTSLMFWANDSQFRSKGTILKIRRSRIVEDAIVGFKSLQPILKDSTSFLGTVRDRIVIRYINDFGEEEKGIDLGGLFKDFMTDVTSKVFNPEYGLFLSTEGLLYPNPHSLDLFGLYEAKELYFFIGQLLGKALHEGITIQPQFHHFFLALLSHGKGYNYLHVFDDLQTLDSELYKNLIFLKTYEVRILIFPDIK